MRARTLNRRQKDGVALATRMGKGWLAALGVCTLLGGCPKQGSSPLRPKEALVHYAAALAADDYARAYQLLDAAQRKRLAKKDFIRLMKANPEEVKRAVAAMRSESSQVKIQAIARSKGEEIRLVVEGGKWRLASNPIQFYSQATPRDALRSFIRAVESRRYKIVLRFVPRKWGESMTEAKVRKLWEGEKRSEVEVLLKELKQNLQAKITRKADAATMPYGDGKMVKFLFEDGVWKIEDPD